MTGPLPLFRSFHCLSSIQLCPAGTLSKKAAAPSAPPFAGIRTLSLSRISPSGTAINCLAQTCAEEAIVRLSFLGLPASLIHLLFWISHSESEKSSLSPPSTVFIYISKALSAACSAFSPTAIISLSFESVNLNLSCQRLCLRINLSSLNLRCARMNGGGAGSPFPSSQSPSISSIRSCFFSYSALNISACSSISLPQSAAPKPSRCARSLYLSRSA